MSQVTTTQDGQKIERFGDRDERPIDEIDAELRQLFADELTLETQRQELAAEHGFAQQESRSPVSERIARLKIGALYEELTGETLAVWRAFLPTRYSNGRAEQGLHDWRDYSFDTIPLEALTELNTARKMNCFDYFEIWTPEKPRPKRQVDPMLVGVIQQQDGRHYYAIARWGEALLPFEKIRRLVRPRRWPKAVAGTLMLSMLLAVSSFVVNTGQDYGLGAAAVVVLLGAVFCVIAYGMLLVLWDELFAEDVEVILASTFFSKRTLLKAHDRK